MSQKKHLQTTSLSDKIEQILIDFYFSEKDDIKETVKRIIDALDK